METRKIMWGIIGPGNIAGKFARDLLKVPGAELYAVASRTLANAEEFSRQYNAKVSYGSYEELVKDEEVDVIYIATPHVYHYEHTILCLNNKKAVLCEKPFAMNLGQVNEMIAVAQENKVFLMEALWTHFLPHYKYLLNLVETKKYGDILDLKADFGFEAPFLPEGRLYNKSLGGGSLLDIGIYPVFAALTLLGFPDEIEADAEICATGIDEACNIKFKYKNGATATLESTIKKVTPTTAVIAFERATVTLINRFHEPTSIRITTEENEEEITFDVDTAGYNFEAEHVQQMLKEGRTESTVMSFVKSRQLIQLLDDIRKKITLEY